MTLRVDHVSKRYGSCIVLTDVTASLEPGCVRALVGENGAGKSTLIRTVCGMVTPDAGTVSIDGVPLRAGDTAEASACGVGVVHQHFMLVDTLSVADNVVLGAEPRRGPFGLLVDRTRARARVRELATQYGLDLDPDALVSSLAVGERQRVELLKVLYRGAKYLLLDEPTAVLAPAEIATLLEVVRGLAKGGAGVLLVSHKLDEVLAVADAVTVLRRGTVTLERPRASLTVDDLAHAVVGGAVPAPHTARSTAVASRDGLVVDGLEGAGLQRVTLRVAPGEVLGVAGVEGNGQTVLARALAGLEPSVRGRVRWGTCDATDLDVLARRAAGLGFVPEDREGSGLVAGLTVAENLALGDPARLRAFGLPPRALHPSARTWIERFGIVPADPDAPVGSLSGGNAQKVLLARELARPLQVLVVAQPTRGIDLGAAAQVHEALMRARDAEVPILLFSADLDELRLLSDRVVVMRRGAIVGEVAAREATDARLGAWMIGDAAVESGP